jgi:hypothetical protein
MQTALEGLKTAAEWALVEPAQPNAPRLYFDSDYADPARRPSDFTTRTKYRWPVSVDDAVIGIAPSVDRAALAPKLEKLGQLVEEFRAIFLEAGAVARSSMSQADEREYILQRRSPIDYAYVDLAEGVHFVYPGMAALPEGYDVRRSSFYRASDHRHGKRWGPPYVDATTDVHGDDLVMPCTEGLWSPTGEFLGVAGVEITVTKLVGSALAMPHRKTLRTSLVDHEGKKLVDSTEAGKRFHSVSGNDEAFELEDFDLREIVPTILASQSGIHEATRNGHRELVAFVHLQPVDWIYVVEVDFSSLAD